MKKQFHELEIVKSSGEIVKFSKEKLINSLKRSGADEKTIDHIVDLVQDELYEGISTKEIYQRAFSFLKKNKSVFASRYKLKKAIYELGPTGFPFEKFVGSLLIYSGYKVEIGKFVQGTCVVHEVDVVAEKNGKHIIAECKFHNEEGRKCDVKIPLYIHSRFQDILDYSKIHGQIELPDEGWVVTNTRFTKDALQYGRCAGLFLLSWDLPKGDALKDRIDRLGLYPVTVSTLLSQREKQFLLSRDVVLCRQLIDDAFYLDHLEITEKRKQRILDEIRSLCIKTKT